MVYADGYESWSPKEVFDKAYKVAETALDRMTIESLELMARTDKLGNFIFNENDGNDYQSLHVGTRAFLISQYHLLRAYLNVLNLRLSCMDGGVECHPCGLSFEQILPMLREGFAVRRN